MKTNHDEREIEPLLSAWVLGELPGPEARRVEQACAADPELARLAGELRGIDRLICETEWSAASWVGWELPAENRERLLEKLSQVRAPASHRARRVLKPAYAISAVAACVALSLAGVWYLSEPAGKPAEAAAEVESIKTVTSADEAQDWTEAISSIEDLRRAVEIQEKVVEEKWRVLSGMIVSSELKHGSNYTANPMAAMIENKIMLEAQIEALLRYDGQQLMTYAASVNLPENIVRSMYPAYLEEKRRLEALKLGGLGERHPNVRQQHEIVAGMRRDLEKGVVALRETRRAQLELAKEELKQLEKEQDRLKENAPAVYVDHVTFNTAREEFEEAQQVLMTLRRALEAREAAEAGEARDESGR